MHLMKKIGCLFLALFLGISLAACSSAANSDTHKSGSESTEKTSPVKTQPPKPEPINWNKPSGGAYPKLKKGENIWLDVSVKQQKVFVKDGDQTLYTMIVSTGLDTEPDNSTPEGTYHVQGERGKWFYTPKYKEGAEYWVSWKNHGEFLFHSVPMDKNKHVLTADAEKLGQKDSHGCIHLTVPDARWIYENIPFNTKVVIHS